MIRLCMLAAVRLKGPQVLQVEKAKVAVDMGDRLVTVIGGSGFVGRHVVRSLAKRGYRVRVACRRPDLAGDVLTYGVPGQIMPVQANLRFPDSVTAACAGSYAVVNLPGLLFESGGQNFNAVHAQGAAAAANAARTAGAQVFIQMSAIGADAASPSAYGRTKAEGERLARAGFPGTIVLRPSIVFGPEDGFFNKFAQMARFSPALPLVGAETRFQPVFVGDVAEAVATLIDRGVADGKTYELGGPEVASFRALLAYVLEVTYRKRLVVPLPFPVARLMGVATGWLPKPPITTDQVALLQSDNVVATPAQTENRTLSGLGITARSFRQIVPTYLYRYRSEGQFTTPSGTPR
jgi:uncharacterized protein YbjT (DUF2867 family)